MSLHTLPARLSRGQLAQCYINGAAGEAGIVVYRLGISEIAWTWYVVSQHSRGRGWRELHSSTDPSTLDISYSKKGKLEYCSAFLYLQELAYEWRDGEVILIRMSCKASIKDAWTQKR